MGPVINQAVARSLRQGGRRRVERRLDRPWRPGSCPAACSTAGPTSRRPSSAACAPHHRINRDELFVPFLSVLAVRRSRRCDRGRQPQRLRPDRRHLHAGQGRARPLPRPRSRPACFTPIAPAARRPAPGPASRPSAAGRGRERRARAGSAAGTSRSSCASRATPFSGRCEQALRFAQSGARRPAARRNDDHVGRLRAGRQSGKPDPGNQGVGGEGPDDHFQQCRRGRLRAVAPPADPPGAEDDLVLRRREQVVRAAISVGRARAGVQSARARWPSGSGRGARASPPSTRAPASGRSSRRASRRRNSTASSTSARPGFAPTSRSSRRGAPTAKAISSSARPPATSIRSWRPPPK